MKNFDSSLYFITDSTGFSEEEFLFRVEKGLQGGATLLQLREKNKSTREYISLAIQVKKIADEYHVPLIIDDRADVALAADAAGVHLGRDDMPIDLARKIIGSEKIIGATAKTVSTAIDAYNSGADYLGVGAIFKTTTKVKTVITSTNTLREICRAVPIPVNAIGGLNSENIGILQGIPIAGICVVSAVMKAKDPKAAVENLLISRRKHL